MSQLKLCHPHQTSIRQGHRYVRVGSQQVPDQLYLIVQRKRYPQPAGLNLVQHSLLRFREPTEEEKGLSKYRLAKQ
jgi:hypothetical protein